MKKNKLFTFLSIITLIFIFGIAASCNLCGASIDFGDTTDTLDNVTEKEEKPVQKQSSQAEQTHQDSPEQVQPTEEAVEPESVAEEGSETEDEPDPATEENGEEDDDDTDVADFAPIRYPPEITNIVVVDRGQIITTDYLYTDMEYEIRVIFTDFDSDTFHYVWMLGWGAGDFGYITDPNAQYTTWITPSNEVEEVWLLARVVDERDAYDEAERRFRIVVGSGI